MVKEVYEGIIATPFVFAFIYTCAYRVRRVAVKWFSMCGFGALNRPILVRGHVPVAGSLTAEFWKKWSTLLQPRLLFCQYVIPLNTVIMLQFVRTYSTATHMQLHIVGERAGLVTDGATEHHSWERASRAGPCAKSYKLWRQTWGLSGGKRRSKLYANKKAFCEEWTIIAEWVLTNYGQRAVKFTLPIGKLRGFIYVV